MSETNEWRRCSACKKSIPLGASYYVCSVSTCNRARTGLVFCDVSCWEVHLPVARHREAWAEEMTAPRSREAAEAVTPPAKKSAAQPAVAKRPPKRTVVRRSGSSSAGEASNDPPSDLPREVLIVASRLKEYVRARAGMNTSDRVLGPLSEIVREVCDEAIRNAERDERKTLLDRDVPRRRK